VSGKSISVALAAIGVLGVGGYFGFATYSSHRAEQEIKAWTEQAAADGTTVAYESVKAAPFGGAVEIRNIEATVADTGDRFTIDRVTVRELDRQHDTPQFGRIAVEGFRTNLSTLKPQQNPALRDLDYDSITASWELEYRQDAEKMTGEVRDLEATFSGKNTEPTTGFTIDRITLHELDRQHDIPHFARVSMQGFEMPTDGWEPEQSKALQDLGFDAIASDSEFNYRFDPAKGTVEISTQQQIDKLGNLSGEFSFGNVELHGEEFAPSPNISIRSASLTYKDDAFLPRLYQYVADQQKVSVEDVKQQWIGGIGMLQVQGRGNPAAAQLATALKQFVQDPKQLRVSLSPEKPVVMGQLMFASPNEIPGILGLKISAN
jgi:hypothetical protein